MREETIEKPRFPSRYWIALSVCAIRWIAPSIHDWLWVPDAWVGKVVQGS